VYWLSSLVVWKAVMMGTACIQPVSQDVTAISITFFVFKVSLDRLVFFCINTQLKKIRTALVEAGSLFVDVGVFGAFTQKLENTRNQKTFCSLYRPTNEAVPPTIMIACHWRVKTETCVCTAACTDLARSLCGSIEHEYDRHLSHRS